MGRTPNLVCARAVHPNLFRDLLMMHLHVTLLLAPNVDPHHLKASYFAFTKMSGGTDGVDNRQPSVAPLSTADCMILLSNPSLQVIIHCMVHWFRVVFATLLSIYDDSSPRSNENETFKAELQPLQNRRNNNNNNIHIMPGEQKKQKLMTGEEKKCDSAPGIAAKIARKNILELQPYRCARDDYSEGVLLDANENAFGPTSLPSKNLDPYDNSNALERYPDPYQIALKELYAKYRGHGLTPANIFVGVGSDEAIDMLMRIFCQPARDEILITPPTYGMYKVCAKVNDVSINSVPLTEDFDLRIPEVRNTTCFLDGAAGGAGAGAGATKKHATVSRQQLRV